ncbi:MAG: hypothetical protein K2K73_03210, partial [Ureaplasma sp.]|nr:hypothetical protein [Ureaplasma sp.]
MNKKSKILMISLLTTSSVFIPTLVATSVVLNNKDTSNLNDQSSNTKYNFLEQEFNSKQDVINYANSISHVYNKNVKTPIKWSM